MIAKLSSRAARRNAAATRRAAGNRDAIPRIVAAARRHFFAHGFRNVTMDDLAGELGMSKKTLYASFRSKEALLDAVLKNKFQSVEADLERLAADTGGDALENLKRLLACLQHHTAEIQPSFVRDIRRSAPQLFGVVERGRRDLIRRYFGRFFAEARDRGVVRRDIRIDVIIEILLGATEAVVNPQKLAELRLSPNEAYMDVINVVLKGIVTDAGRAEL
ncbi:MAG TPA: TetR/AcrR family transcriptional regulator [Candidatus Binatia bacterium]|jgi:AcrR family transcriptional regulator